MIKQTIALLGSAFLLSACLGSGSSTPTASAPGTTTPGSTTGEGTTPAAGLTFAGTVSGTGQTNDDGEISSDPFTADLSLTASVTSGSGSVSQAELSNLTVNSEDGAVRGAGTYAFTGSHPVSSNAFTNLPLTGTISFTVDGDTFGLTSGGDNTVMLGGTFAEAGVTVSLSGSAGALGDVSTISSTPTLLTQRASTPEP